MQVVRRNGLKHLGFRTNFYAYLNTLFASLHVMITTGNYFSLTYLRNKNIKDCMKKI